MLKFITGHMSSIDGVSIYPIISFLIFFGFFIIITYYVITMKKSYVDEVSQIPLEDDEEMDSSNNILATNTKSKP
jgi:cbb3-type cytochrome oxidase subunit 3